MCLTVSVTVFPGPTDYVGVHLVPSTVTRTFKHKEGCWVFIVDCLIRNGIYLKELCPSGEKIKYEEFPFFYIDYNKVEETCSKYRHEYGNLSWYDADQDYCWTYSITEKENEEDYNPGNLAENLWY